MTGLAVQVLAALGGGVVLWFVVICLAIIDSEWNRRRWERMGK